MRSADKPRRPPAEPVYRRLLELATKAGAAGNYAIAAALVVRGDDAELTLYGQNTVVGGDPTGHAEINAIRAAHQLSQLRGHEREVFVTEAQAAGRLELRPCHGPPGVWLFSTLEPCPMCTVAAINAQIGDVTWALDDPSAGAMAPARLSALAPLWPETVSSQGMHRQACSTHESADEPRIPEQLASALRDVFDASRAGLDERLAEGGFVSFSDLVN